VLSPPFSWSFVPNLFRLSVLACKYEFVRPHISQKGVWPSSCAAQNFRSALFRFLRLLSPPSLLLLLPFTMLSRASFTAVRRGTATRFNVYRSFTSTTPLGDQYDVVVIGKIQKIPQSPKSAGGAACCGHLVTNNIFLFFVNQVEALEDM